VDFQPNKLPHVLQEVREGLVEQSDVDAGVKSGKMIILRGRRRSVLVGDGTLVKVNTSVGCSDLSQVRHEYEKVAALAAAGYAPDITMDLSVVRPRRPVYEALVEDLGGPVGTLPHYLCFRPRRGIDPVLLLDEIERQAASGVAWMTLHLTVTKGLYELAQRSRLTAVTARGGGLVVEDMFLREAQEGVLSRLFPEILEILRRHGVALSLGTTFRPANVVDAMDEVHVQEIHAQQPYLAEARRLGVPVMLEAVGHMTLADCHRFAVLVRDEIRLNLPIMTLGPIPTDAAVGEDHIANAVGGAYLAMLGATNILNAVTREEHTGNVPSLTSILEGVRGARIAAHAVNISRFAAMEADRAIAEKRAESYTCVVEGGLFHQSARTRFRMGCTRCGNACPLIVNARLDSGRPDGS
jgi:phosphomethylpyrimidine synthase